MIPILLVEVNKLFLRFTRKCKEPKIIKTNLKKDKVETHYFISKHKAKVFKKCDICIKIDQIRSESRNKQPIFETNVERLFISEEKM